MRVIFIYEFTCNIFLEMCRECSPNHFLSNVDYPVAADIIISLPPTPMGGVPLAYAVAFEHVERLDYATRSTDHLVLKRYTGPDKLKCNPHNRMT